MNDDIDYAPSPFLEWVHGALCRLTLSSAPPPFSDRSTPQEHCIGRTGAPWWSEAENSRPQAVTSGGPSEIRFSSISLIQAVIGPKYFLIIIPIVYRAFVSPTYFPPLE